MIIRNINNGHMCDMYLSVCEIPNNTVCYMIKTFINTFTNSFDIFSTSF